MVSGHRKWWWWGSGLKPRPKPMTSQGGVVAPSRVPTGIPAPPTPGTWCSATLALLLGGRVAMVNTWQGRAREERADHKKGHFPSPDCEGSESSRSLQPLTLKCFHRNERPIILSLPATLPKSLSSQFTAPASALCMSLEPAKHVGLRPRDTPLPSARCPST